MIVFIWFLNFAISAFNAVACGHSWNYTKVQGGFAHFLNWMVAVMAACGFTWCVLIPISALCHATGVLTPVQSNAIVELGYVVIIPAVIFSGIVITIDSWAQFYKKPGILNGGIAAYNTYAQVRNTMDAVELLPSVISKLGGVFGGRNRSDGEDDDGGKGAVAVLVIVILALASGILITRWIIIKVANNTSLRA